jgi:hypothetical protein
MAVHYFTDDASARRWAALNSANDPGLEHDRTWLRKRKIDADNEAGLLKAVEGAAGASLRVHAMWFLLRSGQATEKALPVMASLVRDPDEDVAMTARGFVAQLGGSSSMSIFRSLIVDPKVRNRWTLLPLFAAWGGEEDVEAVADLLRRTYAKRPSTRWAGWSTPATEMLEFLAGFPENAVAADTLDWTRRQWSRLTDSDQEIVPLRVPEIGVDSPAVSICLLGNPALGMVRLYNRLAHLVCAPEVTQRFGVVPVDLNCGNRDRQLARALRVCDATVCVDAELINAPPVAGTQLPKRPVLVLNSPRSSHDWGNWGTDKGVLAAEEVNLNKVREFIATIVSG